MELNRNSFFPIQIQTNPSVFNTKLMIPSKAILAHLEENEIHSIIICSSSVHDIKQLTETIMSCSETFSKSKIISPQPSHLMPLILPVDSIVSSTDSQWKLIVPPKWTLDTKIKMGQKYNGFFPFFHKAKSLFHLDSIVIESSSLGLNNVTADLLFRKELYLKSLHTRQFIVMNLEESGGPRLFQGIIAKLEISFKGQLPFPVFSGICTHKTKIYLSHEQTSHIFLIDISRELFIPGQHLLYHMIFGFLAKLFSQWITSGQKHSISVCCFWTEIWLPSDENNNHDDSNNSNAQSDKQTSHHFQWITTPTIVDNISVASILSVLYNSIISLIYSRNFCNETKNVSLEHSIHSPLMSSLLHILQSISNSTLRKIALFHVLSAGSGVYTTTKEKVEQFDLQIKRHFASLLFSESPISFSNCVYFPSSEAKPLKEHIQVPTHLFENNFFYKPPQNYVGKSAFDIYLFGHKVVTNDAHFMLAHDPFCKDRPLEISSSITGINTCLSDFEFDQPQENLFHQLLKMCWNGQQNILNESSKTTLTNPNANSQLAKLHSALYFYGNAKKISQTPFIHQKLFKKKSKSNPFPLYFYHLDPPSSNLDFLENETESFSSSSSKHPNISQHQPLASLQSTSIFDPPSFSSESLRSITPSTFFSQSSSMQANDAGNIFSVYPQLFKPMHPNHMDREYPFPKSLLKHRDVRFSYIQRPSNGHYATVPSIKQPQGFYKQHFLSLSGLGVVKKNEFTLFPSQNTPLDTMPAWNSLDFLVPFIASWKPQSIFRKAYCQKLTTEIIERIFAKSNQRCLDLSSTYDSIHFQTQSLKSIRLQANSKIYTSFLNTKQLNKIVRSFTDRATGVPLKKYRHYFRTVENCFSGSDAVNWMNKNMFTLLKDDPDFTYSSSSAKAIKTTLSLRALQQLQVQLGLFSSVTGHYAIQDADYLFSMNIQRRYQKQARMKLINLVHPQHWGVFSIQIYHLFKLVQMILSLQYQVVVFQPGLFHGPTTLDHILSSINGETSQPISPLKSFQAESPIKSPVVVSTNSNSLPPLRQALADIIHSRLFSLFGSFQALKTAENDQKLRMHKEFDAKIHHVATVSSVTPSSTSNNISSKSKAGHPPTSNSASTTSEGTSFTPLNSGISTPTNNDSPVTNLVQFSLKTSLVLSGIFLSWWKSWCTECDGSSCTPLYYVFRNKLKQHKFLILSWSPFHQKIHIYDAHLFQTAPIPRNISSNNINKTIISSIDAFLPIQMAKSTFHFLIFAARIPCFLNDNIPILPSSSNSASASSNRLSGFIHQSSSSLYQSPLAHSGHITPNHDLSSSSSPLQKSSSSPDNEPSKVPQQLFYKKILALIDILKNKLAQNTLSERKNVYLYSHLNQALKPLAQRLQYLKFLQFSYQILIQKQDNRSSIINRQKRQFSKYLEQTFRFFSSSITSQFEFSSVGSEATSLPQKVSTAVKFPEGLYNYCPIIEEKVVSFLKDHPLLDSKFYNFPLLPSESQLTRSLVYSGKTSDLYLEKYSTTSKDVLKQYFSSMTLQFFDSTLYLDGVLSGSIQCNNEALYGPGLVSGIFNYGRFLGKSSQMSLVTLESVETIVLLPWPILLEKILHHSKLLFFMMLHTFLLSFGFQAISFKIASQFQKYVNSSSSSKVSILLKFLPFTKLFQFIPVHDISRQFHYVQSDGLYFLQCTEKGIIIAKNFTTVDSHCFLRSQALMTTLNDYWTQKQVWIDLLSILYSLSDVCKTEIQEGFENSSSQSVSPRESPQETPISSPSPHSSLEKSNPPSHSLSPSSNEISFGESKSSGLKSSSSSTPSKFSSLFERDTQKSLISLHFTETSGDSLKPTDNKPKSPSIFKNDLGTHSEILKYLSFLDIGF